ncbi:MAG: hypothetical protein ACXWXS_00665 [Actinomycetota bacterium]
MPVAEQAFGWQEALAAFAVIVVVAFLVTWIVTDLLRVPRAPYIGILACAAFGLGVGYVAWSGTPASDLVTRRWGWALAAGVVAAAAAFPLVRRLPSRPHPRGVRLGGMLLWEAVVYGPAEGLLLATLPVLAVWQASSDRGWTTGGWAKAGSGAMAIAASLLVILVHHLGYSEFRARAARLKLVGALVTCGLQALAFLLTGNVLAPVVAHVLLHGQLVFRGVEMPPVVEPAASHALDPGQAVSVDASGRDRAASVR